MRRKIFVRCFLIAFLSVSILFSAGIATTYVSNKSLVKERLITETKLAVALLNSEDDFEELDIFMNNDECRVTIITPDGEVLYDSDTTLELENHIDREEVAAALAGEPVAVERYSETFGCNMNYYAMLTSLDDGREVIVRLALKNTEINYYILSTVPFLLLALLVSAFIAGVFARRLSDSVGERISDIGRSLKSLNDGDYVPLATNSSDSEFFSVYNEINELNEKTIGNILKSEREKWRLNAVIDNVSQGIIALSGEERILLVNGSALDLFGVERSVISLKLDSLISDSGLLMKIERALSARNSKFEYTSSGRTVTVETVTPADSMLDEEISSIIIISDVTFERELGRQKEEFFANASHELKTPLTAMRGLSELLLAKSEDSTDRPKLERIHKECIRLSDLISDMLKLSLLEAPKESESVFSVDMHRIAEEAIAELAYAMKEKGIACELVGDAAVLAEEKKMYELMCNLLSNAVNYNVEGGSITVTLGTREDEAYLSVRDTGIGISPEHIPHLFERFYRVDKSRSKKTGGTGLGLAIVKHISALFGGRITVESEPGEGTEICIFFKKEA
ncbi:MAG: PAS domain-containing protein [Clostridia bacterium]|nr:PAS domain-containing protein [Clostridia bacterium]